MTEDVGRKLVGSWYPRLKETLNSPEFEALGKFLSTERMKYDVYPKKEDVFKAFLLTPPEKVKILVLGQDVYHDGSATGLAFANDNSKLVPSPSLRNILLECENDVFEGFNFDFSFDLTKWATQGVFLLNMALSVRKGEPGSHIKLWKFFTEAVIKEINAMDNGIIFMLWGSVAQTVEKFIDKDRHFILKAMHPVSPVYGKSDWFGCKHFSKANEILIQNGGESNKINW